MIKYIDNIYNQQLEILNDKKWTKKFNLILMAKIITSLYKTSRHNLCLNHFLLIYTFKNSENDKNFASVPVSIRIAKKMFTKYIVIVKQEYINKSEKPITYTL